MSVSSRRAGRERHKCGTSIVLMYSDFAEAPIACQLSGSVDTQNRQLIDTSKPAIN